MIRILIVDDEQYAREEMAELLLELGEVEIVGSCSNAMEAIKAINQLRPEVLFLDIKMPVLNGFDLLSMLDEEVMPYVVFVTAFDEYALKAFEEKTLDYLLKPVDPERLVKTMEKVRSSVAAQSIPDYGITPIKRIPCVSGHKIKLIDPEIIEYVHSDISGVHVVTDQGSFFTELTLKVLEEKVGLLHCHKQYLVNARMIDEIITLENSQAEIITRSGQKLPVSRRYLRKVKDAFSL